MCKRSLFISAAFLGLVPSVWAGVAVGPFHEQKGVLEFTGEMIVRPMQPAALADEGYSATQIAKIHQRALDRLKPYTVEHNGLTDWVVMKVPSGYNESTYSTALMRSGDYEYAVPNWRVYALAAKKTPNDTLFPQMWRHKVMHSEEAWSIWTGTSNVTVAIVDTGVFTAHPDLSGGIVKGYDAINRKAEVDGGDVQDGNGHGTHCAGDAAAQGNNSLGVVGEGWKFHIMPVRAAYPEGYASFDDLLNGALWAAGHGAKVVSVSFSGVDYAPVGTTGTTIKAMGSLLLWAAGNDNRNLDMFSYPDTIVVGASDSNDQKAGFSAYGKGVAVFAPGVDVWSTTMDGGYQAWSGTSMATPVTNGVCAMIWSINPDLTPDEVQTILYNSCDNIGSPSIFGHGRVNLYKAALAADASKSLVVGVAPASLALLTGTYYSGNLNNVINGSGSGYRAKTKEVVNVGFTTMVQVNYKVTDPVTKLKYIAPDFRVQATAGPPVTAMSYIWNISTKKWQLVKSVTMNRTGATEEFSGQLSSNLANYVASDGTVKTIIRMLSPVGRRGESGTAFTGSLRFAQLVTKVSQF